MSLPRLLPATLALLTVPAPAQVSLTLAGPAGPQDPDQPMALQATVAGAGPDCSWLVLEAGFPARVAQGVRLEPAEAGGAHLTVAGREEPRTLVIRAASRQHPDAYAVATVRVRAASPHATRAAGAGPPGPATAAPETKGTPTHPRPGARKSPHAWQTPFSRPEPDRRFDCIAWDSRDPGDPAILATECPAGHDRTRIVRIRLTGDETEVTTGAGEPPLGPAIRGLGILPGGDLVVTDPSHRRLARVSPDGAVATLAGGGRVPLKPRTRPDQERTLAAQARLGRPDGLAVAPDGTVVFADRTRNQLCQATADGRIDVIAGTGAPGFWFCLDPDRPWPATATDLAFPEDMAGRLVVDPDGRILCSLGRKILTLGPDRSADVHGDPFASPLAALAVTTRGLVVGYDPSGLCRGFRADGQQFLIARQTAPLPPSNTYLDPWREPLIPGRQFGPDLGQLVPVPGGGVLALARTRAWVWHVGPPLADTALADLVERAAAGAAGTDPEAAARAAASRDGLRRRALGRAGAPWLAPAGKGGLDLPSDLAQVVGSFLVPDPAGLALRARIALHVLDRLVRRQDPATADRFGAWPLAGPVREVPAIPAGGWGAMAGVGREPTEGAGSRSAEGPREDPDATGTPPAKRRRRETQVSSRP